MRRRLASLVAALAVLFGIGVPAAPAAAQNAPYDVLENQALRTMCIDDSIAYGLRLFSCNGMDYQKWYIDASWPNPYTPTFFQNVATERCLDDSVYGLRAFPCNGGVWQVWSPHRWNDGTWQFQNQATGRCLTTDHNGFLTTNTCSSSEWESWYRYS